MDKAKSINESWELPPLRSLTDFLLESSRFQLPNFGDLEKWGNRVVNNLVYYQTNYLYMTIAIMLIVGSMHPLKMIVGMLAMLAIWGQCFFVFSGNTSICEIRTQYPQLPIILTVICACYVAFQRYAVLIFLFSLLLSFCVTFIHASLRLRNLKNKLVNKIGGMGLDRTPIGIFLKYFDDIPISKVTATRSSCSIISTFNTFWIAFLLSVQHFKYLHDKKLKKMRLA